MKWIKKRENQIFFSVTLITILVAVSPLLTRYCLTGHDSEYHILRIEALRRQIEMGLPFIKINPFYFGGAGYASSLFYPDLLLFIPALLRIAGFSINSSYHLYMIVCVILCYTVTYSCGKRISNNRYIGILFAIIITLSSYHLDDILVRAAAGEYTAFIFVPIVVFGIYNLCYQNMDKPWILGLGMGLVLMSHTLSFVMCILMLGIMLLFNFDVFLKTPKLILKLIITGAITIVLTVSYWGPVLEQFVSTQFYVSKPWIEPAQEAVKLSNLFGLGFPTLGIGLLLLLFPRILIFRNEEDSVMKFADQSAVAGVAFAVMASDIVPWDRIGKYFSIVQFPWRLYLVSTVLLSLSAAVYVYRISGALFLGASDTPEEYDDEHSVTENDGLISRYGIILAVVLSVMTVATVYTFSNQNRVYYDYSNDYFDYKPFTATVIAGEWLPMAVEEASLLVDESEHLIDNTGREIDFVRDKNAVVFATDSGTQYADVPFVFYKGYVAKGDDGTEFLVDGNGNNGFVRVYTNGYAGGIRVHYAGTVVQKISGIFSIRYLIIICAIAYFVLKKRKAAKQ